MLLKTLNKLILQTKLIVNSAKNVLFLELTFFCTIDYFVRMISLFNVF